MDTVISYIMLTIGVAILARMILVSVIQPILALLREIRDLLRRIDTHNRHPGRWHEEP